MSTDLPRAPTKAELMADLLALPDSIKREMVERAKKTDGKRAARNLAVNLGLTPPEPKPVPMPALPAMSTASPGVAQMEEEIAKLSPANQAAAREAAQRVLARRKPHTHGIRIKENRESVCTPELGGAATHSFRLRDAFGTRSSDFAQEMVVQLACAAARAGSPTPFDNGEADAMIAAVEAVRPENEVEAMLAVQMAATHKAAMRMLERVASASGPEQAAGYGGLATKLLRTFPAQVEALAKLRRGGEQKVRVEHVHVYEGGQAIVGHVEHGRGRGKGEARDGNDRQPHAPGSPATRTASSRATMRSADPERQAVPIASGGGQEALPNARRGKGKRRTNG